MPCPSTLVFTVHFLWPGDLDGWDGGRWEGSPEEGDICIHKVDSLHCTAVRAKLLLSCPIL